MFWIEKSEIQFFKYCYSRDSILIIIILNFHNIQKIKFEIKSNFSKQIAAIIYHRDEYFMLDRM